jgi:hypothetical protein
MANANRPTGLAPVKYLGGADWDGKVNIYQIAANNGTAFFPGDPVTLSGDGDTVRGIPGIAIGVAGSAIVGVLVAVGTNPDGGPYIDPNNLTLTSAPATKTQQYYAAVVDDPNVIFEIQEVGTGTQLTSAEIGLNANFVAGTPATGVKYSGFQLDNSTEATTSTLNLKLLGLARRPDNAFGQYAKWLCLINNHLYRGGITGV